MNKIIEIISLKFYLFIFIKNWTICSYYKVKFKFQYNSLILAVVLVSNWHSYRYIYFPVSLRHSENLSDFTYSTETEIISLCEREKEIKRPWWKNVFRFIYIYRIYAFGLLLLRRLRTLSSSPSHCCLSLWTRTTDISTHISIEKNYSSLSSSKFIYLFAFYISLMTIFFHR